MSLNRSLQMSGMTAEKQAQKAVAHVLNIIASNPHVGWYMGWGTQSFALLTEAHATATGEDVEEVREQFAPKDATNPGEAKELLETVLEHAPSARELEAMSEYDEAAFHVPVTTLRKARELLG